MLPEIRYCKHSLEPGVSNSKRVSVSVVFQSQLTVMYFWVHSESASAHSADSDCVCVDFSEEGSFCEGYRRGGAAVSGESWAHVWLFFHIEKNKISFHVIQSYELH